MATHKISFDGMSRVPRCAGIDVILAMILTSFCIEYSALSEIVFEWADSYDAKVGTQYA
jgi:hypothetical protein